MDRPLIRLPADLPLLPNLSVTLAPQPPLPTTHVLLAKKRRKTLCNRYILTFLLFRVSEIADQQR